MTGPPPPPRTPCKAGSPPSAGDKCLSILVPLQHVVSEPSASRLRLVGALVATYLMWGASFLAIRVLVQEQPPWSTAGARFLLAGSLLAAYARWRGARWPDSRLLHGAFTSSLFLFVGTYGGVFWASRYLPSGFVALVMASIPIFVVIVEALRRGGARSGIVVWLGLVVGLAGVLLLLPTGETLSEFRGGLPLLPALVCVGSAISWAIGTSIVLARRRTHNTAMMTAAQMTIGGTILFAAGLLTGERLDVRQFAHTIPAVAMAYLVLGASLLAFVSYIWLLEHVSPAFASSYAYVNPLVAVALGVWWLSEPITTGMWFGGGLVVAAVILVSNGDRRRRIGRAAPAPVATTESAS